MLALVACGGGRGNELGDVTPLATDGRATEGDDGDDGSAETASADDTGDGGAVLDVGSQTGGGPQAACHVVDEMDAPGACQDKAPPESFDPTTQWTWIGDDGEVDTFVIPLVANLTDDNADGSIDLCDIPDVVVVAAAAQGLGGIPPGHIYVVSGDDGHTHRRFATEVDSWVTPALGDIDDDGVIEIVSATPAGYFVAFDPEGTVEWTSKVAWEEPWGGAVALADLDGDGSSEIVADNLVLDSSGSLRFAIEGKASALTATTAADIDGLPGLEVVTHNGVYRSDGTPLFELGRSGSFPQVANMDEDPEPEILYAGPVGVSLYHHDGTPIFEDLTPTGSNMVGSEFARPAAIHDFTGDGWPEFATGNALDYAVHRRNGTVVWQSAVEDYSGLAGGTGFDFLGDGVAEAMYGDEVNTYVFGENGETLLSVPRVSGTLMEYPVVADIDNDGSAEVIITNHGADVGRPAPTIEVIRDREDRWVGARRIWNQHTYHVTNVREDGTIPQVEVPSWTHLNTFRTNAQVQDGGVCLPTPEG
ncbi:MAG: VCBS repeat-containing protein [Myxococcota bacterium]